ncbi:Imm40 family immunity protein [Usitatibacter palustris]|uniref:Imm40 family immunity protein n=1 Tax=Usitatibacter palustris TaxID=2732487 RepID=UPI001488240C|nr:Imm40 family immunity protein [Usitatibacter palustris]
MASTLPKWTEHLDPDTRAAGVDLSSTGFADAAWPIERGEAVVAALQGSGFAVLGGDLLLGSANALEHTYDSWSCDIAKGEPWSDYVTRSCANAILYLTKMQKQSKLWFTVVVMQKPSAAQLATSHDR